MTTGVESTIDIREYRVSELHANDLYDYQKISNAGEMFLPCELTVENERAVIAYNIDEKEEFINIMNEGRLTRLKTLIDVSRLYNDRIKYDFSINPDNLYFDMYGKVFVMFRDVSDKENYYTTDNFVEEYKALIGSTLSEKYSFNDYFQGGSDLLKKDKFLAHILKAETVEEIYHLLSEEAEREHLFNQEKKIEVDSAAYKFKNIMTIISFVLIGILVLFTGYEFLWLRPYNEGVINAQNAYLDMNYAQVIEEMKEITVNRLERHQKYILAVSYVKCENLTEEQRNNILAVVDVNGNEKILDYWISIGRLETENAENIAQQISDNQLLLYAYLKEKYVLEADTEISGVEKTNQLKMLEDKINNLAKNESTKNVEE